MATLVYPSAQEMREIEPDLLVPLVANLPLLRHFPITEAQIPYITWEQRDAYRGLQRVRGLNGQPTFVEPLGAQRFLEHPGYYGEGMRIEESEMMHRRAWGRYGTAVINLEDLVRERQEQLLVRRLNRIEWILWQLLQYGIFSVANDYGVIHTGAYPVRTQAAAVAWATVATATPIADFQAVQLLSRGSSTIFDQGAEAWMNRVTANYLLNNTNAADLRGRRTTGFVVRPSLGEITEILTGDGLPNIVIYDRGYVADNGTWTPFIATNKVVVIGRRENGDPLGEYRMTLNASNPNFEPGPATMVIDEGQDGPGRKPVRGVNVFDMHNGGPLIYYPGGVVVMNV